LAKVQAVMIAFPNAKINLGLHVKYKRGDGFHEIETILYPVPLCDILEVMPAGEHAPAGRLLTTGVPLPVEPGDNIIEKAQQLFRSVYETERYYMHLHKQIPHGAGLGGGSSDAAAALKLFASLSKKNIPLHRLREMAAHLGSDCAFFIDNIPALATGRGEKLSPVESRLKGYFLVILKPPVSVSTAWAYSKVSAKTVPVPLTKFYAAPPEHWRNLLYNDFEEPVFAGFPVIGEMKNYLYKCGAVYASMSGSGSAVYGIFEKEVQVKKYNPDDFLWSGRLS
jgi:4-diphosphocytidyl-2-C-methyl-D-erythritol kinase